MNGWVKGLVVVIALMAMVPIALTIAPVIFEQIDTIAADPELVCLPALSAINDLSPLLWIGGILLAFGTFVFAAFKGGIRLAVIPGVIFAVVLTMSYDVDRAEAASSCLLLDGSLAMTGNLAMGGNNITNLGTVTWTDGTSQSSASPTAATFVVCSSTAQNSTRCDYSADGTADEVQIQAAIAALPASGGMVALTEGVYNVDGSGNFNLDITASNLQLVGMGPGITTLRASTKDRHLIGNATASQSYLSISNMTLDHDAVTLDTGLGWHVLRLHEVSRVWIEDLEVSNSAHHGIVGLPDTANEVNTEWFLNNLYLRNIGVAGAVGGDGIRTHFGSGNVVMTNIIVDGVELHGIHLGNHRAVANNIVVRNSGQAALSLQSQGQIVSNFYAEWDAVTADLAANRPAAGTAGRLFYATDTAVWSRDNGSAWKTEAGLDMDGVQIDTRVGWATSTRMVINNAKLVFAVTENEPYDFDGGDAIRISSDAGQVQLTNIQVEGKFRVGALILRGDVYLTNFVIENVRHHGIQLGQNSGTDTGFVVANGSVINSGQETANAAIFLHDSARDAFISGVRTSGANHTFGIQENSGADDNIIAGNNVNGVTGGIDKQGTSSIVRGNLGHVTENSGTATLTVVSSTVTHGLAVTPAARDCWFIGLENPTTDVGTLWVSGHATTTITLNLEVDPGASDFDIAWFCEIR